MRWRLACVLCWACSVPYALTVVRAVSLRQDQMTIALCAGAVLPWVLLALWSNARANRRG